MQGPPERSPKGREGAGGSSVARQRPLSRSGLSRLHLEGRRAGVVGTERLAADRLSSLQEDQLAGSNLPANLSQKDTPPPLSLSWLPGLRQRPFGLLGYSVPILLRGEIIGGWEFLKP